MTAALKAIQTLEGIATALLGIKNVLYRIDVTLDQMDSKLPNDSQELAAEVAELTEENRNGTKQRDVLKRTLEELITIDILAEDYVEQLIEQFEQEAT